MEKKEKLFANWFIAFEKDGDKIEEMKVIWSEPVETYKQLGLNI